MKWLNLYAGIGGNRKKWEGVEVTAVEIEEKIAKVYSDNFKEDKVIIGDAHEYLKKHYSEYDGIWSSIPCQKHSRMMKATRHNVADYPDMNLYAEIIFLKHFFKGKWVVENVIPYYDQLIQPTAIIGRHYFWSNFNIGRFDTKNIKGFILKGTSKETEEFKKWLGIHYNGNLYYKNNHCPGQVLRNCVHPDLGLHIFNQAMGIIKEENVNQIAMF